MRIKFWTPFVAFCVLVAAMTAVPVVASAQDDEPAEAPVVGVDDLAWTDVGAAIEIGVTANDTDDSDDADVAITVTAESPDGSTAITVEEGEPAVEFTPTAGFDGVTTFTYEICVDGSCDTADVDVYVGTSACTIVGTNGADTLTGTDGDDVICGRRGADIIDAGAGNDIVFGGRGKDAINGGDGDDVLRGGRGDDTINGGPGDDQIHGSRGTDMLSGDDGADSIYGGKGPDTLNGGTGNDLLIGKAGDDTLNGDGGDDLLRGWRGNDVLNGGEGNDELYGGRHADELDGGPGNDELRGKRGNDTLLGGPGDDLIYGNRGADIANGDDGNDDVRGNRGNDDLDGGNGVDTVNGGNGADTCDDAETAVNCETETTNGEGGDGEITVDVTPIFECWVRNADGSLSAYFGYENLSTDDSSQPASVVVELGVENQLSALDGLQPTAFGLPGVVDGRPGRTALGEAEPNAFIVADWDGADLTWTLLGQTATASQSSTECDSTTSSFISISVDSVNGGVASLSVSTQNTSGPIRFFVDGELVSEAAPEQLPEVFLDLAGRADGQVEISAEADGPGAVVTSNAEVVDVDFNQDSDLDGLPTYLEERIGADPALSDTDGDGLDDADEFASFPFLDPADADTDDDGVSDADDDIDQDGLSNGLEIANGSNPLEADSDFDGLDDSEELAVGLDPIVADTDGDGLDDGAEGPNRTDPNNPDTDGDGTFDGADISTVVVDAPGYSISLSGVGDVAGNVAAELDTANVDDIQHVTTPSPILVVDADDVELDGVATIELEYAASISDPVAVVWDPVLSIWLPASNFASQVVDANARSVEFQVDRFSDFTVVDLAAWRRNVPTAACAASSSGTITWWGDENFGDPYVATKAVDADAAGVAFAEALLGLDDVGFNPADGSRLFVSDEPGQRSLAYQSTAGGFFGSDTITELELLAAGSIVVAESSSLLFPELSSNPYGLTTLRGLTRSGSVSWTAVPSAESIRVIDIHDLGSGSVAVGFDQRITSVSPVVYESFVEVRNGAGSRQWITNVTNVGYVNTVTSTDTAIVVTGPSATIGLDPATGAQLWQRTAQAGTTIIGAEVVGDDLIEFVGPDVRQSGQVQANVLDIASGSVTGTLAIDAVVSAPDLNAFGFYERQTRVVSFGDGFMFVSGVFFDGTENKALFETFDASGTDGETASLLFDGSFESLIQDLEATDQGVVVAGRQGIFSTSEAVGTSRTLYDFVVEIDASQPLGSFVNEPPSFDNDFDGDLVPDCVELAGWAIGDQDDPYRTFTSSPFVADTDGDGLFDGSEVVVLTVDELAAISDQIRVEGPTLADSLGTTGDTALILTYSDPNAASTNPPPVGFQDLDDSVEYDQGSNAFVADTDRDGLGDLEEAVLGTVPTSNDTDGDGFADKFENDNRPDGFDPVIFTEAIRRESFESLLSKGFACGDVAGNCPGVSDDDANTVPYLVGSVAGSFVPGADVRDVLGAASNGDLVGTGLNIVGLVPVFGDAFDTSATLSRKIPDLPAEQLDELGDAFRTLERSDLLPEELDAALRRIREEALELAYPNFAAMRRPLSEGGGGLTDEGLDALLDSNSLRRVDQLWANTNRVDLDPALRLTPFDGNTGEVLTTWRKGIPGGEAGEAALRRQFIAAFPANMIDDTTVGFVTSDGWRYVDIFDVAEELAVEVKVGVQTLTDDLLKQMDKDLELVADLSSGVERLEWHFLVSENGAVSFDTIAALDRREIPWVLHLP